MFHAINVYVATYYTNVFVDIFILNISTDIDECDNSYDECSDICINVPGGYNCDCQNGYYLKSNGKDCEGTF